MNTPAPASDSSNERRAEQEFRRFFRSQIPDPFPPFQIPTDAPLPKRNRGLSLLARSRTILAICVTALAVLLGALMNNGASTERTINSSTDGVSAKRVKDPLGRPIKPQD